MVKTSGLKSHFGVNYAIFSLSSLIEAKRAWCWTNESEGWKGGNLGGQYQKSRMGKGKLGNNLDSGPHGGGCQLVAAYLMQGSWPIVQAGPMQEQLSYRDRMLIP